MSRGYPNWDALVEQHATTAFIQDDPIAFPHRYFYNSDWRDTECTAFLAALFSYGNRKAIREALKSILEFLGPYPVNTLCHATPDQLQKRFHRFYYRFNTNMDLIFLLTRLAELYRNGQTLKTLWQDAYKPSIRLPETIHKFRRQFLHGGKAQPPETHGMRFLLADPMQGSAAKRFNMFLRWMVRKDAVDLGLWADIMTPAALIMPLDTHVGTISRKYRITCRKANDWKTAEEITQFFRKKCPEDPVRYDFALFGLGISRR